MTPPPPSAPAVGSPSPATATPPSLADREISDWQIVVDPAFEGVRSFYPAVWSGTRFILPGIAEDGVVFLTSVDGRSWDRGSERSWGYTSAFTFDPAGAGVAVGWLGQRAAVWRSVDGIRWPGLPQRSAFLPGPDDMAVRMTGVAWGPAGYVAIGDVNRVPGLDDGNVLWTSHDGLAWTRRDAGPLAALEFASIGSIGGLYVVAGTLAFGTAGQRAVIWTSTSGTSWQEVPVSGTTVTGMAIASGRLFVTGTAGGPGLASPAPAGSGRAWSTVDGVTWQEATGSGIDLGSLLGASWGLAARSTAICLPCIATSDDGVTWRRSGEAPYPYAPVIAVSDRVVVAPAGEAGHVQVWVASIH